MAPDRNGDRPPESKDALDRWAEKAGDKSDESGADAGADESQPEGKKAKGKSPFANVWVRIGLVVVVLLLIAGAVIWIPTTPLSTPISSMSRRRSRARFC
jgi:hypothetical protein